jgi:hypothetical protein
MNYEQEQGRYGREEGVSSLLLTRQVALSLDPNSELTLAVYPFTVLPSSDGDQI